MTRTLIFHCPRCRLTSMSRSYRRGTRMRVRCRSCNAEYRLDPARDRHDSDEAYLEQVLAFAWEARLDLPVAWSLLEGIISAEQAEALARPHERRAPRRKAAVAVRRGVSRATWVAAAAAALLLATLAVALQARALWSRSEASEPLPSPTRRAEAAPPATRPAERTTPIKVWTDASGEIVRIEGPDPAVVLAAFCKLSDGASGCYPLGLTPTRPADPTVRLGHYQDLEDLITPFAIRIHRDPRSATWVSGDGATPIPRVVLDAPPGTADLVPFAARPIVVLPQTGSL